MKKHIPSFIVCSVIASALNYATYPALARILTGNEFVRITVALSLFTQVSTFLSSIIALTVGITKSSDGQSGVNAIMDYLQNRLMRLFLLLTVCLAVISPWLLPHLHLPVLFVVPISLMLLVSLPSVIMSGFLNAQSNLSKLGVYTLAGGILQFCFAVLGGALTHNGVIALICMAIGQLLTIVLISLLLLKNTHRPNFGALVSGSGTHKVTGLVTYAIFSSLAIMAINLVQLADLLIVQSAGNQVKFYADIYIISRIVFFGGAIFLWPFLSELSVTNRKQNYKPLLKVTGYFAAIACAAILALSVMGSTVTHLLFNSHYTNSIVRNIGILSVIYKFLLLIINAVVLYFVVQRSYLAVWLSLAVSTLILGYAKTVTGATSITTVLVALDIIASVVAVVGIIVAFRYPLRNGYSDAKTLSQRLLSNRSAE